MNNIEFIEFVAGTFHTKGFFYDLKNDKKIKFKYKIEIFDTEYDYETAFPESEESRILQEKIEKRILKEYNISSKYIDLEIQECSIYKKNA